MCVCVFFFFSSRRRHTRFDCDWSSDVCSSDLFVVDTVTDDEGGAPETPGVTTIIGIDGIPWPITVDRSEEHTSELQSQSNLVCRLLLEKKKNKLAAQPLSSYMHQIGLDVQCIA